MVRLLVEWAGRRCIEAIRDLVRDDDGNVFCARQVAEQCGDFEKLGCALRHCRWTVGGRVGCVGVGHAFVGCELGAVVCGDAVDYHETYIVSEDCYGELVAQDVFLRLEV